MNRRRKLILGTVIVGVVAASTYMYFYVIGLGCGLGNASVYPVTETNQTVDDPNEARRLVVSLYDRNTSGYLTMEEFIGNETTFNEEYVRTPERKTDEFTDGIRQRGAPLDRGETYYLFGSVEEGKAVGVTEEGEVFFFEQGIC